MSLNPRRLVIAAGLLSTLALSSAQAVEPQNLFYQAYYIEKEQGNYEAAGKLYDKVLDLDPAGELAALAKTRLDICREELASADLTALMPAETLFYAELNKPGQQISGILDMLGLLSAEEGGAHVANKIAVSPKLIKGLLGMRGFAVALTGFDARQQRPSGVAVLHPGNIELIHGALESILPAAGTAEPIAGKPTYFLEDGQVYICLSSRLIIAATDKSHIQDVLERIGGEHTPSLADNPNLGEVLKRRRDSLLFFCMDAKSLMPLVAGMAGGSPELAQARALLDLDKWRWLSGQAGVHDSSLSIEIALGMDEGHHNIAYNLARTPPITRDTLTGIPQGVAGFLAVALNHPSSRHLAGTTEQPASGFPVTGLDLGREFFANLVDLSVFALPPGSQKTAGAPVPDLAAVMRVHDASKSQALWNYILGIATMAAGAPTLDGTTHKIAGLQAQAYTFDDHVTIHVARLNDKLLISTSERAMKQAAAAARGSSSIVNDPAFAPSLQRITEATSKVVFLNPGRCLQIARMFMSQQERAETAPFVELFSHTVAGFMTDEAEEQLRISAAITGLPDMAPFLTAMIEKEHQQKRMHTHLREARQAGEWDEAMQVLDGMIAEQPQNLDHYRKKFDILALGKGDHEAACSVARSFLNSHSANSTALNNFAWALLTEEKYGKAYNALALQIAEQACEQSNYENWALLDTLALARFRAGNVAEAIKLQKKAVELQGGKNKGMLDALHEYEAARQ